MIKIRIRKSLNENISPNEKVIAYHRSKKRFDKFDMAFADKDSHSGVGLFFAEDPRDAGHHSRGKYLYKVELTLRNGEQWKQDQEIPDDITYQYDTTFDGRKMYKMLDAADIEIINIIHAYTGKIIK